MTDQPRAERVNLDERGVCLSWSDGETICLVPIWLRDNCRCRLCGDTSTGHRFVTLAELDNNPMPAEAQVDGDEGLRVVWRDGHASHYGTDWLLHHARRSDDWKPVLWDAAVPPDFTGIEAARARDRKDGTFALLRLLRDQGTALIRGLGPGPEETEAAVEILGPLQMTSYGRFHDNRNECDEAMLSNSAVALMPHTDEPFRYTPPGIIAFHCVRPAGEGGETILLDGFRLAEEVSRRDHDAFHLLTTLPQSFERHVEDGFDLICHARAIALDGYGRICGFRFAERSASPPHISPEAVEAFYGARRLLASLVADPAFRITLRLEAGDLLLFDNHRVMHGRTAIAGPRHLRQCSVAREDVHSTLRMMARRRSDPEANLDLPMGALA